MDHYCPMHRLVQSYLASSIMYGNVISGLHPNLFWVWSSQKGEIKKSMVLWFYKYFFRPQMRQENLRQNGFRA